MLSGGAKALEGRCALVTGGAVGIGSAITLALARAGADVALTYHRHPHEETTRLVQEEGRRAVPIALDVTERGEVDGAVEHAAAAFGQRIDVLVNNAGGLVDRVPVSEMTDEHWHEVLDLNLTSAFYCSRAALPYLPDRTGRIINIASLAAFDGGGTGGAAYAAAKAALVALTRGLAKEVGGRGVTANALAPGLILNTPFHDTFSTAEMKEATIARTPIGRGGTVEDVGGAVAYLASDAGAFVTGEVIHINGGLWFG